MEREKIIIIGGGASGMMCAISAARRGAEVVLLERMPVLGKKLSITGAGRCNLANDNLSVTKYHPGAGKLVESVFLKFGKDDIVKFFTGLGLFLYSDCGRIFPVTNQSASVLTLLEKEIKKLSVSVELGFCVKEIIHKEQFLIVSDKGRKISSGKIVIAGGGKSYPALGADGSLYGICRNLGHNVTEPVPGAVPLIVKDRICHLLQGQRIAARAESIIDGKVCDCARGDLLFTKYGLSGTAVIDISASISDAINRRRKKDVSVAVDMVPFLSADELSAELKKRMALGSNIRELLIGILPNKFGAALEQRLSGKEALETAHILKHMVFSVSGTRGWNEAEFSIGGVNSGELKEGTLESKKHKGLYFAGEIIDVGGRRGGYNLAWAWASGYVAGLAE